MCISGITIKLFQVLRIRVEMCAVCTYHLENLQNNVKEAQTYEGIIKLSRLCKTEYCILTHRPYTVWSFATVSELFGNKLS